MREILLNHWKTLVYHDPAVVLRKLRAIEYERAGALGQMDADVRALRTNELNKYREWRDAALFTYGMGLAEGVNMGYATEASGDYDFVVAWTRDDTTFYCPVQLKELVPAERNPKATVDDLLRGLRKYGPTRTVLAIRLNRRGQMILDHDWPAIPFAQLWFFWASAPDSSEWTIYGDALRTPCQWAFKYPG